MRPVLVFDGSCVFCRRWVQRLSMLDRSGRLVLLPLQDPDATTVTGQPLERLRMAVHLVRPDGMVFAGAAAAGEAFRYLRGGWLVHRVLSIPGVMPIAERLYARIARRYGPAGNEQR
jgi:acetyl esterase